MRSTCALRLCQEEKETWNNIVLKKNRYEALRRWWKENGRSTVAAVVIALAAGFGWQAWQANEVRQQEQASDIYQALLHALGTQKASPRRRRRASNWRSSSRVNSAARPTPSLLRCTWRRWRSRRASCRMPRHSCAGYWARLPVGSDTAQVAQLRLARVLAASGDTEQALAILEKATPGPYGASYAAAQGDILLAAGRKDEARDAYTQALADWLAVEGANLSVLQQKLQSLTPAPAVRPSVTEGMAAQPVDAASATNDTVDVSEE